MTISGNLSSRIFRVEQNVNVVLRNLSIVNGRFVNGAGVSESRHIDAGPRAAREQ